MADEEKKEPEKRKPDVVLRDGREVFFDLEAISITEYRAMLKPAQTDEEESATLAKVSGLKPEDIDGFSLGEWKRFTKAFFRRAQEPTDPN
jgi:hypothetical protein